ncbi:hypothetical protein V8D89_005239 [Ganoderma adspersum]
MRRSREPHLQDVYYHAASFATQFSVGALPSLALTESSLNVQALFILLFSLLVQNMRTKY